jgi:hypothetical protein
VVNSLEYSGEQKALLFSMKETAEFVKIPISRLSTAQRKIDNDPEEIVRMLRALRTRIVFAKSARNQCRVSGKTLEARPPAWPSGFMLCTASSLTPISRTRIGGRRMDLRGNV